MSYFKYYFDNDRFHHDDDDHYDDDRYERDDDDDHEDDYYESYQRYDREDHDEDDHDEDDNDDIMVVGGVTYTEASDDVYVSATGDTIVEADDRYDSHDNDDIMVVGGVTYTETSDDVYVSATGDTIVDADDRYDADFVTEALSSADTSNYDLEQDSIRFSTTKEVQVTGSAVDMDDFSAIISHIVGVDTLSTKGQVAADVDGNGSVDINDAVQVLLQIWSGTQANEFALVGASDISTAELVMIGDVNDSVEYLDFIA
jgi:hypothetical protein